MIGFRKIKKAILLLQNKLWVKGLFSGVGAGIEHVQFLKTLNLNCLIDIGANKGQFALVVRGLFPKAVIHSFEPLVFPATIYKKIFFGDSNSELYNCAVGEREEEATIHVSKKDDSSSLLPISKLQSDLFPGTEEERQDTVKVSPLSSILSVDDIVGTALLKIDVQGYELNVLRGCSEYLNKFQHVYVECSFVELYQGQALAYQVIEYLSNNGFKLAGVFNLSNDSKGIPVQADFYFHKD